MASSSEGRGKKLLRWKRRMRRKLGQTYILFHQKRHPQEMGALEVEQFLTHLAVQRQVSQARKGEGPF